MEIDKLIQNIQINNVGDLIKIGMLYDPNSSQDQELYKKLFALIPPLLELDTMVGLENIKKEIVTHIIYHIQNFHNNDPEGNMLHMTIEAPPGSGKTVIASIIAKIYSKMGFLSEKNKVTFARRKDFIASYVGQTVNRTSKLLNSAKGGVLVIDEVYTLGQDDTFSKEAIDTINQFLSENREDLICIVMGYPEDVDKYFFKINKGLSRRFPYRYTIEPYTSCQLREIFNNQVINNNWAIEDTSEINSFLDHFFTTYKEMLNNNGGDTEFLLTKAKIQRAYNTFGTNNLTSKQKYILTLNELQFASKELIKFKEQEMKTKLSKEKYFSIYS